MVKQPDHTVASAETPPDTTPGTTAGTLLDGRIVYHQFAHGYRTGIEPVLLAASIPARRDQHVFEAGSGAGAALLCLAARVPGLTGLGVERDPALAALALDNARANDLLDRLDFRAAPLQAAVEPPSFHHAMANPPWHNPRGTASPDPHRNDAKRAHPGQLAEWVAALATHVRPRGTVSIIVPAAQLDQVIVAFAAARCGAIRIIPLWPRCGQAARLMIARGTVGQQGGTEIAPGLILHDAPNGAVQSYTAAADLIVRGGAALE